MRITHTSHVINIYILTFTPKNTHQYISLLSVYQQNKIKNAANKDYIAQQITSELLLLYALRHENIKVAIPLDIGTNEYGKPYINKLKTFYNTSHTNGAYALSLSAHPTGIDIEAQKRDVSRIKARFLSANEENAYKDAQAPKAYALRVWTRKEALLKYVGLGLVNDLFNVDTTTNPVTFLNEHVYLENFTYNDFVLALASKEKTHYNAIAVNSEAFNAFLSSLL